MATSNSIVRLILVYNADSGFLSSMAESARKLLGGGGCTLCSLTHGLAGERAGWQECREELGILVDHVHRDELQGPLAEAVGGQVPAVVAEVTEGFEVLLSPGDLEQCRGQQDRFQEQLRVKIETLR